MTNLVFIWDDTERKGVTIDSLLERLSESARIQDDCEDFEEAWNELAKFLVELTKELKQTEGSSGDE